MILAALLCFTAFFGESILDFVKNNVEIVDDTPAVPLLVEPSMTYKELVKNIVNMDIEKSDAKQISDFFSELSSVVNNDPGFIKTTGEFRQFNMTAGGLNFAGIELKNKYPNLGEEIDEAIGNSIGMQDQELSSDKRSELIKCLNAIAWAVYQ